MIILKYPDGTELGLIPEIVGSEYIENFAGMDYYKTVQKSEESILKCLSMDFEEKHTGYVKDSLLCLKRAPIEYYLSQDPELSIQDINLEDYK